MRPFTLTQPSNTLIDHHTHDIVTMCDSDACARKPRTAEGPVVPVRDFGSFHASNVHELINQPKVVVAIIAVVAFVAVAADFFLSVCLSVFLLSFFLSFCLSLLHSFQFSLLLLFFIFILPST